MRRGTLPLLLFIVVLAVGAAYVIFWPNPGSDGKAFHGINNPFTIKQGLDLQGGIRVLLQPIDKETPTDAQMQGALQAINLRVNYTGINEPTVRLQSIGNQPGISVELPGANSGDQNQIIASLQQQGKVEIWNTGSTGANATEGSTFDPSQYSTTNGKPLFTGADLDASQLTVSQGFANRGISGRLCHERGCLSKAELVHSRQHRQLHDHYTR